MRDMGLFQYPPALPPSCPFSKHPHGIEVYFVAQQFQAAVGAGTAGIGAELGQGGAGSIKGELSELTLAQVNGHGPALAGVVGGQGLVDFG